MMGLFSAWDIITTNQSNSDFRWLLYWPDIPAVNRPLVCLIFVHNYLFLSTKNTILTSTFYFLVAHMVSAVPLPDRSVLQSCTDGTLAHQLAVNANNSRQCPLTKLVTPLRWRWHSELSGNPSDCLQAAAVAKWNEATFSYYQRPVSSMYSEVSSLALQM